MIAAWMLYSLAVGVLVGLAALAGDRACRLLQWPRRGVWLAALAATVLLSLAALLRVSSPAEATSYAPSLSFVSSSRVIESASGIAALGDALLHFVRAARSAVVGVLDGGYAAAAAGAERLVGGSILLVVWAACSVAALLLLGLTMLRVYRARRSWRRHRIGEVPVLLSEGFGPAVIGLLRPAIVVPSWLLTEPIQAQQVIVEHEEEHRRAKDPLLLAAACVGVCLLPWNLALWWLLSRVRLAVELDCDDRILRRGVTPLSYGSLLLEIAGRTPARLFGAPALADSRLHLERRLLAMTQRNHTAGLARPALAATAALVLAAAACGTDVPTAAAIEDMDAVAAEQQAKQAGLLPTIAEGRPLYIVDGKVVTEAEARAVAPDDISSIEVLKRDAAAQYGEKGAQGVIRMKTRVPLASAEYARQAEVREGTLLRTAETAAAAGEDAVASKRSNLDEVTVAGYAKALPSKTASDTERDVAVIRKAEVTSDAPPSKVRVTKSDKATQQEQVLGVKTFVRKAAPTDVAQEPAGEVRLRRTAPAPEGADAAAGEVRVRTENPFVIVDGVPASPSVRLQTIAPDEIRSVEVLKGEEAVRRYGARAAYGAILITTLRGASR